MGYNAVSTDPLYKHIPFTITQRSDISYGLFYDNLSSCWLDLGNEIDNYHTAYRRWQAEAGDIDYYLFTGKHVVMFITCRVSSDLHGCDQSLRSPDR